MNVKEIFDALIEARKVRAAAELWMEIFDQGTITWDCPAMFATLPTDGDLIGHTPDRLKVTALVPFPIEDTKVVVRRLILRRIASQIVDGDMTAIDLEALKESAMRETGDSDGHLITEAVNLYKISKGKTK